MEKIPVTIVTGFLGAGKTTLINKVLKENHDKHPAVIINEFGEVGVDHEIVLDVEEEIYQMNNGCICCTLRSDLSNMLKAILNAKEKNKLPLDQVLFETTGLADPSPIAQTFFRIPFLKEHFYIDSVIAVVDAKNILMQLEKREEPLLQIAFADKILISKVDQVTPQELAQVKAAVKQINQFVEIQEVDLQHFDVNQIFDQQLFQPDEHQMEELVEEQQVHEAHHHDEEEHHHEHGEHDHDHHEHLHHIDVASFAIEEDRPLDLKKINRWLNELIFMFGMDMYRYKGILSIKGVDQQIIFQGVNMAFDISKGKDWGDLPRKSSLVFIGKDLPEKMLRSAFQDCVAE